MVGLEGDGLCAPARRGSELPRCCPEHVCVCGGLEKRVLELWEYFKAGGRVGESDLGTPATTRCRHHGWRHACLPLHGWRQLGSVAQVAIWGWIGRYNSLYLQSKTKILIGSHLKVSAVEISG